RCFGSLVHSASFRHNRQDYFEWANRLKSRGIAKAGRRRAPKCWNRSKPVIRFCSERATKKRRRRYAKRRANNLKSRELFSSNIYRRSKHVILCIHCGIIHSDDVTCRQARKEEERRRRENENANELTRNDVEDGWSYSNGQTLRLRDGPI